MRALLRKNDEYDNQDEFNILRINQHNLTDMIPRVKIFQPTFNLNFSVKCLKCNIHFVSHTNVTGTILLLNFFKEI